MNEALPDTSLWQTTLPKARLRQAQLHLWRFRLASSAQILETSVAVLNQEELSRAERLLVPVKKNEFITARACLRRILGHYLGIPAAQVMFQYNEYGKPFLADSPVPELFFNLSHSGGLGLLGILKGCPVGIDVEWIEPGLDYIPLVNRYFDQEEQDFLLRQPVEKRRHLFYCLWCRKEAILKLHGGGFRIPMHNQPPPVFLQHYPITPDYVSAVAAEAEIKTVVRFELPL